MGETAHKKPVADLHATDFPDVTQSVYASSEVIVFADDKHYKILRTKFTDLPVGVQSIDEFPALMDSIKDKWINDEIRTKLKLNSDPFNGKSNTFSKYQNHKI